MKLLPLNNGRHIPALGLGTWEAADNDTYKAVRTALEIGYRHIDGAAIYGNEQAVGKAIADAIKAGDVTREELNITSKLWNSCHLPKDVQPACEKSLRDLQLDYIDTYLMHWPVAQKPEIGYDLATRDEDFLPITEAPLIDTWQAMETLAAKGFVKNIGVSNFSIAKLKNLMANSDTTPAINQVECHPYLAQPELLDFCLAYGIVLTAFSPLGSGGRPDFLIKDSEPTPLLENQTIKDIAAVHAATPAQVLIAWQLARDIIVIPKSANPQRLQENFDAQNLHLTANEVNVITDLNQDYRYFNGDFFNSSIYSIDYLWND